jgi:hypothetical protein
MIIHLATDLATRPIEPIRIVDVSPFHTPLRARRPSAVKAERWIPGAAAASLAVGVVLLAFAGS